MFEDDEGTEEGGGEDEVSEDDAYENVFLAHCGAGSAGTVADDGALRGERESKYDIAESVVEATASHPPHRKWKFWNILFKEDKHDEDVVVSSHYRYIERFGADDPKPVVPGTAAPNDHV